MKREKIPDPYKMKRVDGPRLTREQLAKAKVRITTYLDDDVVTEVKKIAKDAGGKYQTILNQFLRDYIFGKKKGLVARIDRLEKAVFSK